MSDVTEPLTKDEYSSLEAYCAGHWIDGLVSVRDVTRILAELADLRAKLAQAEEERDKWHQTAVATVKAIITGANPKDAERILRRDYQALFTTATEKGGSE